jgi:hypothetical protein
MFDVLTFTVRRIRFVPAKEYVCIICMVQTMNSPSLYKRWVITAKVNVPSCMCWLHGENLPFPGNQYDKVAEYALLSVCWSQ